MYMSKGSQQTKKNIRQVCKPRRLIRAGVVRAEGRKKNKEGEGGRAVTTAWPMKAGVQAP